MNSLLGERRKNCPMRHQNGNCTVAGGFCTAVNDPICDALHCAYDIGGCHALAKAKPVLHGRWKQSDFIPGMLACNSCGAQRNPNFKIGGGGWHFCPNCGVKMDGGAGC